MTTILSADHSTMHSQTQAKSLVFVVFFILQLICVLYLLIDAISDFAGWEQTYSYRESDVLEYAVVLALMAGLAITGLEIRNLLMEELRRAVPPLDFPAHTDEEKTPTS